MLVCAGVGMVDKNIKNIIEKEKTLPREGQWKSFPPSIKLLFALLIFHVLFSLLSLGKASYFFLGITINGLIAVIVALLLNVVGSLVLLFALWKKFDWAWKYGAVYFGFFILNGLVALAGILLGLLGSAIQSAAMTWLALIVFLILVLNTLFLFILIKNRQFFDGGAAK